MQTYYLIYPDMNMLNNNNFPIFSEVFLTRMTTAICVHLFLILEKIPTPDYVVKICFSNFHNVYFYLLKNKKIKF